jgi:hypothetical protein
MYPTVVTPPEPVPIFSSSAASTEPRAKQAKSSQASQAIKVKHVKVYTLSKTAREETPPEPSDHKVRRQIREQRLSLSRS